ncbi:phage tail length tape measure family protein [Mesorhizobium sp. M2A.F.Ca.ET.039.01.1.1]|uniref:phage tail length tape measure family protein n=1 Tax=Mesorhizobium sp. M2A.F.Ca.ET.039.01.1.1 TaxID=2496746 RepID=UPI000FC9CC17|nr:phage tail length tape measure family protein [Mesorhizobium sp. M2A.F.Ca.ET.039.01.1.1]RWX71889.1 hypothetical protein EOA24_04295 [Mesorhizobium sp. M2A.F.Ca.ET.039.01.1.1]TIV48083.1 MAG: hypothetical protein E5V96_00285 [Mesorhizobium sp.]
MASDTEDLILSISADTKQIQRALQRLTGDTRATTAAIQQQFDDLGNRTAGSFDKVAVGGKRAFTVIQGGAKDIQTAMKASSFQTANLASQLQDIAVQLKGGGSPLTIALQQGTQINQVIGQAGAAGAVKALGGAFASLINPVSLATIATITLIGYAVEYFSEIVSGGDKSEQTLKQEAELIDRVAQKWGDALPAVKAYADERKRALEEGDIRQATQLTIDEQFKEARETVKGLTVDIADLVSQLRLAGAPNEEIVAVQRAFTALQKAVDDGKDSTKENKALLEALSTAYFNRGVPAADAFARKVHEIADGFAAVAKQADEARKAQDEALNAERFRGFNGPPGAFTNPQGIHLPASAPTPDQRPSFEDVGQSINSLNSAIDAFVRRVDRAEGRGDNPNSSASGVGQFIESTWLNLFKKYYPQQADSMSRDAILALRDNADVSYDLIRKYAAENAKVLQDAGVHVDEAALQLAHFLGAGDAAKVLNAAPGTPLAGLISQASINANPTILGGGRTVDDAIAYAQRRAGASVSSSAKTPSDIFQGSMEDIQRRIDLLNAEAQAQAGLNPLVNDYGFALDKAKIKQQLLNDAAKAGVEVTPELAAKIDELAGNYAKASSSADAFKASQQKILDQQRELNDFGRGVLGGIIDDLRAGKDAGEIFANVLNKIADKLEDMALNALFPSGGGGLFSGLFGGGGGGLLGGLLIPGILHSGGVAGVDGYGHGRAVAASTFAGARRMHGGGVAGGLQPGEVPAILQKGEVVLPRGARAGGSSDTVRVVLQDDSGRMSDIADQRIKTHSGTIVDVAVQRSTKAVRKGMPGYLAEAQSRSL